MCRCDSNWYFFFGNGRVYLWVALAHVVLAVYEVNVLKTRYIDTDTTVPQVILVAQYWRSWITFMCVFHFVMAVLSFLFFFQPIKVLAFVFLPAFCVVSKLKAISEELANIASWLWLVFLWHIIPILTLAYWFPTPQNNWYPGCIFHKELCDPAFWGALNVSTFEDFNVMINQYGKPPCPQQFPVCKACNDCDPFFKLGFFELTVTWDIIFALVSLAWWPIRYLATWFNPSSICAMNITNTSSLALRPHNEPLLGVRISQTGLTKIQDAVASMVRRQTAALFCELFVCLEFSFEISFRYFVRSSFCVPAWDHEIAAQSRLSTPTIIRFVDGQYGFGAF